MVRTALPASCFPARALSASRRSIATAAASLLPLLAAPSFSAQFNLLVVDNGGLNGAIGQPIVPSAGAFYRMAQAATAQGIPPSREFIGRFPVAEFSSYIAMGGSPATLTDTANPPANIIGPQFDAIVSGESGGAKQVSGVRYNFPIVIIDPVANPFMASPTHSTVGPLGPDSVFLGRLTVQRGQRPIGTSIVLGVTFNHLARSEKGQTAMVRAVLNGPAEIFDVGNSPIPTTALLVKSRLAAQVTLPEWGDADVYDLYAVSDSEPPKILTGVKVVKPLKPTKPVKIAKAKAKRPSKPTKILLNPSRELIPDTSEIQYGPTSSSTTPTPSTPSSNATGAQAASPEPVLVREILSRMGVK